MAFVGNRAGPRSSDLLDRHYLEVCGWPAPGLEEDIAYDQLAETRNEVRPVHVDEEGRPYLTWSSPHRGVRRFYLDEYGYALLGDIVTHTAEEQQHWGHRQTQEQLRVVGV